MIEIKMEETAEFNDNFESKYTYIDTIYVLKKAGMKVYDRDSYHIYKHNYYDNKTTLESIIDFGRQLVEDYGINSIKEIELYDAKISELVTEWLLINPYPYIYFNCKDVHLKFARDCIICYSIYNIHKWLIKIERFSDKEEIPEVKVFNGLESDLFIIDFEKFVKFHYDIDIEPSEFTISLHEKIKPEIIAKLELIKHKKFEEYSLEIYCNFIRENVISMVLSISPGIEEPSKIERSLIYEEEICNYRIKDSIDSIFSLACNELIGLLTSKSLIGRTVCHNPECNNDFDAKSNKLYCNSKRCQKYRNNKKNKAYYERTKES